MLICSYACIYICTSIDIPSTYVTSSLYDLPELTVTSVKLIPTTVNVNIYIYIETSVIGDSSIALGNLLW